MRVIKFVLSYSVCLLTGGSGVEEPPAAHRPKGRQEGGGWLTAKSWCFQLGNKTRDDIFVDVYFGNNLDE